MINIQQAADQRIVQPLQKVKGALSGPFNEIAGFIKRDKGFQPAAIITGILLGTTALATPVLGSMVGAALALAGGLFLLLKTSNIVVDNASAFGEKAKVPSMALGIGLGALTSLPELFVSTAAMLSGNASIAIGNITGSNIANILLVLGGASVLKKMQSKGMSWKFNAAAMCASTAVLGAQMALGFLSPVIGGLMLGGLGLYLWKSYLLSQKDETDAEKEKSVIQQPSALNAENAQKPADKEKESPEMKAPKWFNIGWGFAGVAGLVGSAAFVVSSAIAFGTAVGISPVVVGVLAVAVGTSLPELMVSFKSALKGDANMSIGNILGSNVFNILGIGGLLALTGAVVPPDLDPKATWMGLVNTAALGASALLLSAAMLKSKGALNRKHGIIGLGLYAAFTAANIILGRADVPAAAAPPPAKLF